MSILLVYILFNVCSCFQRFYHSIYLVIKQLLFNTVGKLVLLASLMSCESMDMRFNIKGLQEDNTLGMLFLSFFEVFHMHLTCPRL